VLVAVDQQQSSIHPNTGANPMNNDPIYSVGDSVRFGDTFATIAAVDVDGERYAVQHTREQLLDTLELVSHHDVQRYRKQRYELGDVVELHVEPTHEGPHESDVDNVARIAIVERVETHPNNDAWVIGYGVLELVDVMCVEHRFVKRGSVARLASSITHDQLCDIFVAAGVDRVELTYALTEELFDNDGMPMLSSLTPDAYARLLPLLGIVRDDVACTCDAPSAVDAPLRGSNAHDDVAR
jgi:hypothetical protein